MAGVPQDPKNHPEGDAHAHTLHVVDAMSLVCDRDGVRGRHRTNLMLAALLHDVGKAVTTRWHEKKAKWTAYGHDAAGVGIAEGWLASVGFGPEVRHFVGRLVCHHMAHVRQPEHVTDRAARKLVAGLAGVPWRDLFRVMEADASGRPPLPRHYSPSAALFNARVAALFPGEEYDLTSWKPI